MWPPAPHVVTETSHAIPYYNPLSVRIPIYTVSVLVMVAAFFVTGCGRNEVRPGLFGGSAVVIARAGDVTVTADEFQLAWEFGHGHLRRGDDPVRSYIAYMLAEKVLAEEARTRQLDTLALVRHNVESLREDLLVERVFTERVTGRIEVSDQEIDAELTRNAVRFQFRFVPAPDSIGAARIYDVYLLEGFEAAAEVSVGSDRAPLLSAEWTSPLLGADDIAPDMLSRIQDLEIGVPGRPVRHGDIWYVFEVMDIRRRGIALAEDTGARASARKVIFNRKALDAATRFVADTMTPLDVTTRREGFEALEAILWSWYRAETPTRKISWLMDYRPPRTGLVDSLRVIADMELVHFGRESWSVTDFLYRFTPDRYPLRARDRSAFRGRLADVIALVVRDHVFMQMATREGWENAPVDRELLARWEEKWLFLALGDTKPTFSELTELADSLLSRQDIEIAWSVLDTLSLSQSKVNPFMTVHLMKGSSNRMPFPIVDPNWKPSHVAIDL